MTAIVIAARCDISGKSPEGSALCDDVYQGGYTFFDLVDSALERGFEAVGINDYILSRATSPNPSSSRLTIELGKSDTKPFHYRHNIEVSLTDHMLTIKGEKKAMTDRSAHRGLS